MKSPITKIFAVLGAALLPFALAAAITVDIDNPIKDQRASRAGTGVGYSGSLAEVHSWDLFEQFFVKEPDKTWQIAKAGGYWFDRIYGASQRWQNNMRIHYAKDAETKARLAKHLHDPKIYFDWAKKHGVRSLNVLECHSGMTNYVAGGWSGDVKDVKKGILDYVKWIVDNGYRDQIVGFELGNEPYFGSDPEDSAYRWSQIVPEIKRIFPEVDIGISVAEYREGDPDIAAVRRRSTAVDKWFEGGSYFGFNKVNQWSGRFIVASSNYLHHISHVIYHFYGGNTADGLGPCGYDRIRHFAKAFPEVANKRVWVTEWRERSDEDCRCHQMFSSTLTKAHYILSSTAAKMFDGSSLHTATSLSGGFAIATGKGDWLVQWDPAGRCFSDPDCTGTPRIEVGPAGPMFRLYNEALQHHPLICAFGGWNGLKDPEKDWTGVCFYNNTGNYEAWHCKNEEGPPPRSGGGPTWVAAVNPDRTSLNLLICNSLHAPWKQNFIFPGYKIVGKKHYRTYSCKAEHVQRHMIPGEEPLAWEEEYDSDESSITIKPYTVATVNLQLEKAKEVVGILSDTFVSSDPSSNSNVVKALSFFEKCGVGTILHAGGLVDNSKGGSAAAYKSLVEKTFTNGIPNQIYSFAMSDAGGKKGDEMEKAWKAFSSELGAKHSLYDTFEVGGVNFVVAPERPEKEKYESAVLKALKKADGKRVVVLQRRPVENTTVKSYSDDAKETYLDGSSMKEFLSKHKNIIVLSGHVRSNPRDERSLWQGDFSAVAAGGLCDYRESYVGNADNIATNDVVFLMFVFKDSITFTRYDLRQKLYLQMDWGFAINPAEAKDSVLPPKERAETGFFNSHCKKVTIRRDETDAVKFNFQEASANHPFPSTWRYRVELYATKEGGVPFARKDVRGSWDMPGNFYGWFRKTRGKSVRFSGSLFGDANWVRAVVTPESYFGDLGTSIEYNNLIPSPAKGWNKLWEGNVAAQKDQDGWTAPVSKTLFANCEKGLVSIVFSYAASADAKVDLVDAKGRSLGLGFTVASTQGNALNYAFEFERSLSDSFAIKVSDTKASDVKIKVISVSRFGK